MYTWKNTKDEGKESDTQDVFLLKGFDLKVVEPRDPILMYRKDRWPWERLNDPSRLQWDKPRMWDLPQDPTPGLIEGNVLKIKR